MSKSCHSSVLVQTARLLMVGFLVSGCGINPQKQPAIPTSKNFTAMSCEQIAAEKQRIEASYVSLRFNNHHGTQQAVRELNGETQAINDAIRINACRLAFVQIPGAPITEVKAGK